MRSLAELYRAQRALLMRDASAALSAACQARAFAEETARTQYPYERDFIRAEWLIGAALVASTVAGRGEAFAQPHSESKASGFSKDVSPDNHILANASPLQRAERHLQEALSRDRKIGLVELEAAILLEFAKLRFVETRQQTTDDRKNVLMQESFDFAHEALAIAERCEYRLDQADIHGFLAEWWLAETGSGKQSSVVGQRSSVAEAIAKAREHAERAKERASCDGAPYHYKVAYERAERLLKSLEARQ